GQVRGIVRADARGAPVTKDHTIPAPDVPHAAALQTPVDPPAVEQRRLAGLHRPEVGVANVSLKQRQGAKSNRQSVALVGDAEPVKAGTKHQQECPGTTNKGRDETWHEWLFPQPPGEGHHGHSAGAEDQRPRPLLSVLVARWRMICHWSSP